MTSGRYCTAHDVRTFTGLSKVDADDLDLEDFLDPATKAVIEQITVSKDWEILSGTEDSTIWYTTKYPIADVDGDNTVDTSDVKIYEWSDVNDASTKSEITSFTVTASEGKITLTTAPAYDTITANYRYYPNQVDLDLLKHLTALYCGYLYTFTKWVWIPDTYQLGPVRARNLIPMWEKIYKEYVRLLQLVQKRQYAVREPYIKKSLESMDKVVR